MTSLLILPAWTRTMLTILHFMARWVHRYIAPQVTISYTDLDDHATDGLTKHKKTFEITVYSRVSKWGLTSHSQVILETSYSRFVHKQRHLSFRRACNFGRIPAGMQWWNSHTDRRNYYTELVNYKHYLLPTDWPAAPRNCGWQRYG